MRDSELAALDSMRLYRVHRGWLIKVVSCFAAMALFLWWL